MFLKSDRLLPPTHLTKNRNVSLSIFSRISLIRADFNDYNRRNKDCNDGEISIKNGNIGYNDNNINNDNEKEYGNRNENRSGGINVNNDVDVDESGMEGDRNGCVWQAVVTGVVSCISGAHRTHTDTHSSSSTSSSFFPSSFHSSSFPSSSSSHSSSSNSSYSSLNQDVHMTNKGGLCAVGCTDGTLHLLALDSGLRLAPPMVLGMGVVAVDVCALSDSIRILAVTVDGELWVWESHNNNVINDNGRNSNGSGRNGDFQCVVRSSIKAPLASMRQRHDHNHNYNNDNNSNGRNRDHNRPPSTTPSSSSSTHIEDARVSLEKCSLSHTGKVRELSDYPNLSSPVLHYITTFYSIMSSPILYRPVVFYLSI